MRLLQPFINYSSSSGSHRPASYVTYSFQVVNSIIASIFVDQELSTSNLPHLIQRYERSQVQESSFGQDEKGSVAKRSRGGGPAKSRIHTEASSISSTTQNGRWWRCRIYTPPGPTVRSNLERWKKAEALNPKGYQPFLLMLINKELNYSLEGGGRCASELRRRSIHSPSWQTWPGAHSPWSTLISSHQKWQTYLFISSQISSWLRNERTQRSNGPTTCFSSLSRASSCEWRIS